VGPQNCGPGCCSTPLNAALPPHSKLLITGDETHPKFGVGDANANCPQILSYFKISSTRLLALQCSKTAYNPQLLTAYSPLPPKIHLQRPSNHHFRRKIGYDIFLAMARTTIPPRIHQIIGLSFQVKKSFLSGEGT